VEDGADTQITDLAPRLGGKADLGLQGKDTVPKPNAPSWQKNE
jgi:hypothetical protein